MNEESTKEAQMMPSPPIAGSVDFNHETIWPVPTTLSGNKT